VEPTAGDRITVLSNTARMAVAGASSKSAINCIGSNCGTKAVKSWQNNDGTTWKMASIPYVQTKMIVTNFVVNATHQQTIDKEELIKFWKPSTSINRCAFVDVSWGTSHAWLSVKKDVPAFSILTFSTPAVRCRVF